MLHETMHECNTLHQSQPYQYKIRSFALRRYIQLSGYDPAFLHFQVVAIRDLQYKNACQFAIDLLIYKAFSRQ
jgi:hypothetical protein